MSFEVDGVEYEWRPVSSTACRHGGHGCAFYRGDTRVGPGCAVIGNLDVVCSPNEIAVAVPQVYHMTADAKILANGQLLPTHQTIQRLMTLERIVADLSRVLGATIEEGEEEVP